jgi:hypothetical protein
MQGAVVAQDSVLVACVPWAARLQVRRRAWRSSWSKLVVGCGGVEEVRLLWLLLRHRTASLCLLLWLPRRLDDGSPSSRDPRRLYLSHLQERWKRC